MTTFFLWYYGIGLVFAPFHYAIDLAYFQREWPRLAERHWRSDVMGAVSVTLFGIFMGAAVIPLSYFTHRRWKHGLQWTVGSGYRGDDNRLGGY